MPQHERIKFKPPFFRNVWMFALVLTFAGHACAGILEDGEDFSNNLISDIAPLLSLFGEQVTMQFMSQSTGWADCILLAMAPIGVITILVSAIRVGGPPWLKAIVGRARETKVASELEIMSSTSGESCELWNGDGVVKCQGASSVREFICVYPKEMVQGQQPANHTSQIESVLIMDVKQATISRTRNGYLSLNEEEVIDKLQNDPEKHEECPNVQGHVLDLESGHHGHMESALDKSHGTSRNNEATNSTLTADMNSSSDGAESCEVGASGGFIRPKEGQMIIIRNQEHLAPNISLNCQSDGHRHRIWIYAALSMALQAGVLVYYGFVTDYHTLRYEKNGQPVDAYAMPLAITGTLLLVAGMLICSHVVNKSTEEKIRQADRESCAIAMVWLQKEKVVSDQLFKSAAIYPNMMGFENITSARRRPEAQDNSGAKEPDIALRTLTTIGSLVSVLGIGAQFTGLRGMHWTAAIVQLGAVILTAIIRAVVRLHLAPDIKYENLIPDFELDWFVMSLVDTSRPTWLPDLSGNRNVARDTQKDSPKASKKSSKSSNRSRKTLACQPFTIQTGKSTFLEISASISDETDTPRGEEVPENSYCQVVSEIRTAKGMLDLRRHLGDLWKWESPVSKQARILSKAIEETLGFFDACFDNCLSQQYPSDEQQLCTSDRRHPFCSDDSHSTGLKKRRVWRTVLGTEAGDITFDAQCIEGTWHAGRDELDAALSLWVYSAHINKNQSLRPQDSDLAPCEPGSESQSQSERTVLMSEEDVLASGDNLDRDCLQILGASTKEIARDLALWLPTGMDDILKVALDADEKTDVKRVARVGRSGQRLGSENKSRETSQPRSRWNPGSPDDVNEGTYPWWAVSSKELPEQFYAKDLFSSFVWALAEKVQSMSGGKQLGATVQLSDNEGSSDVVKLKNRDLSNLVTRITELGKWTKREVFLCLIPALSAARILPGARPLIDLTLEAGAAFEKSGKWDQACEEYIKLRRLADKLPSGSHAGWKALAVLARFDARISKIGIRRFGSQLDDAYESDEVSDVRKKVQDIFAKEKKYLNAQDTLEKALSLYNIFPESPKYVDTLQHIALWDALKEDDIWRRDVLKSDGHCDGQKRWHDWPNHCITKRATFERDVFDRTPLHHVMGSNAPTKSQSLPQDHLDDLEKRLKDTAKDLKERTNQQVIWSEESLRAVLNPAEEYAEAINLKADPRAVDLDHWTPLHYACHVVLPAVSTEQTKRLKKEVVEKLRTDLRVIYHKRAVHRAKALIGRKVSINAQGLDGTTPLHCAAASGCEELVELLVKNKANINVEKVDGTTPLHCAMMSGRAHLVKFFLRHQSVETVGADGRTLLHLAAMTNNSAMFSWLKTSAEEKDQAGRTPLHLAAMCGATDSICELIDLGAKKDAKDHKGRTPLHLACLYNCPSSVKRLLDVKSARRPLVYIDPNAKDERGQTPLHLAALFNSCDAIISLLKVDDEKSWEGFRPIVDFHTKDMEGRSPLHLAALSNAQGAVKLLMEHMRDQKRDQKFQGQDERWPPLDEDEQTPFHVAAGAGNDDTIRLMARLMIEYDLDQDAFSLLKRNKSDKFTAFSLAAHSGHISTMKAFLDIKVKTGTLQGYGLTESLLRMKDATKDTPYMDALRNGLWDVRSALVDMAKDWNELWPQDEEDESV